MARSATRVHYTPENPDKYTGSYPITLRSSWEIHVAQYFDRHPDVLQWASEPVQIPYFDPVKQRQSVYVPDFLVRYLDASRQEIAALVEVKPAHETFAEQARDTADDAKVMTNAAKWEAAVWWCQRRGIEFKVMTEGDLFGGATSAMRVGGVRKRKDKRGPIVRRALAPKRPRTTRRKKR